MTGTRKALEASMFRMSFLVVLTAAALATPAVAQYVNWSGAPSLPQPTAGGAAAVVGGKLYFAGGYHVSKNDPTSNVYRLDSPTSTAWTQVTSLPSPRWGLALVAAEGRLWAIGGRASGDISAIESWDPATESGWRTESGNLAEARRLLSAVAFQGRLYALGGAKFGGELRVPTLSSFPPEDSTSQVTHAPMPTPRATALVTLQDRLFALGGSSDFGGLSMVEVWTPDPSSSTGSGTWTTAATAPVDYRFRAGARLGDFVFLTGGNNANQFLSPAVDRYDPAANRWEAAAAMLAARAEHALVAYGGGLYAIGGLTGTTVEGATPSSSVERADLAPVETGVYHTEAAPSLATPRTRHAAVVLGNGSVLVAGGRRDFATGLALATAEVLTPTATGWVRTVNDLPAGLMDPRAVRLRDGRALFAGGRRDLAISDDLFVFDPASGTFTTPQTGATVPLPVTMRAARTRHTVTLLGDGRVLIAGGISPGQSAENALGSYEFFAAPNLSTAGAMMLPGTLSDHTSTLLHDGRVLIAGGRQGGTTAAACFLFDPRQQKFVARASMLQAREGHSAALLADGSVFVSGGVPADATGTEAEVYDPVTDKWFAVPGAVRRSKASVSVLPSGQVLIAGGFTPSGATLRSMELFSPKLRALNALGASLPSPRAGHRAVAAPGADALLIGGETAPGNSMGTTEKVLYGPQPNRPPVAAVQPPSQALRRERVQLDGGGSTDPDQTSFAYLWTRVSGPSAGALTKTTSAVAEFTTTQSGGYGFRLLLTDPAGATATAETTVTVLPNQPPSASAGPTQAGTGGLFLLDGRASGDPEQDPITYAWSLLSGPAVSITSASSSVASVELSTSTTTYRFRLDVTDDGGLSATAVTTVVVTTNRPPVANAGPGRRVRLRAQAPFEQVQLDGRNSSDADGDTLRYSWLRTAGPSVSLDSPSSSTVRFTPQTAAIYDFRLTVDDGRGLSGSASVRVTVDPFNRPPTAMAGADTTVTTGAQLILDGGDSSDPDGDPLTYAWRLESGPATPQVTGTATRRLGFKASEPGVYTFELAVTDDRSATARDLVSVTVVRPNERPSANAGPDTTVVVDTIRILDGDGSSDPEGQTLVFLWTQLSGVPTLSTGLGTSRLSFRTTEPGSYVFRLLVRDPLGLTATDDVLVTAVAANAAPISEPGQDITSAPLGQVVTLDGGRSFDPDTGDRIAGYQWRFTSVPATTPLSGADTSVVRFRPEAAGTYVLELAVADTRGAIGRKRVTVIVSAGNRAPFADAGADRTVAVSTEVRLEGGRSGDPDGDLLGFRWRQLTGEKVELRDALTPSARFTPLTSGARQFELTVSDGKGGISTDTVVVTAVPASEISTVAALGFWSRAADLPTPRRAFAAVAVRGKLYTFGGSRGTALEPLSTVEIFDPLAGPAGAWTAGPPMPTARIAPSAVAVGARIFVIGGRAVRLGVPSDTSVVEVFDTASQTWLAAPPILVPRRETAAGVIDGKLYVAGGVSSTGATTTVTRFVERFDPLDPQRGWSVETPLTQARRPAMTALNGRLFVVGGDTPSGADRDRLEIFTPASPSASNPFASGGTWNASVGARKPTTTVGHAVAALRSRVVAAGGRIGTIFTNVVEQYDPFGNRWNPAPALLAPRAELALVNLNGSLYAIGGVTRDRNGTERSVGIVERFDAGDDHASNLAAVKPGDTVDFGGSLDAAIEKGGDIDFFRFGVPIENMAIRVDTGPADSFEDTFLSLFDSKGQLISSVDDPRPGVRLASATFVATAPGDYFASVRLFDARSQGLYSIRVRPAPPARDDLPNAPIASAPSIASTTAVTGELEAPGDVDVLRVDLVAGKDYVFRTALGTLTDTVLALLGPGETNPKPLRENDDGPDGGLASRVDFSVTESGRYYLRIRSFDPRAAGTYSVFVAELASKVFTDDHPNRPAGLRSSDTLLHTGNKLTGDIGDVVADGERDVDFFRIVTLSASAYAFVLTPTGTNRPQLTLFDRDGNTVLAEARDTSTGTVEIRGFRPSFPGTYFLRVSSSPRIDGDTAARTGAYTLASELEGTETPASVVLARELDGETLSATVVLDSLPTNSSSLRSLEFGLRFDPALLELKSVGAGTATTAGQILRFASPQGFLGFSVVSQEQEISTKGSLVTVMFRSLGSSPLLTQSVVLAFVASQSGLSRYVDLAPEANPGFGQVVRARVSGGRLAATIPDPVAPAGDNRRAFVRLDGRGSFDPNLPQRALSYAWTLTTAPVAVTLSDPASPIPTFAPGTPGVYEFALTVSNGTLRSLPRRVRMLVGEENRPPTALVEVVDSARSMRSLPGQAPLTFVAGASTVQLDARQSADPDPGDRGRLTYSWAQVTGPSVVLSPNATSAQVSFTPTEAAVYEFDLVVRDRAAAASAAQRAKTIVLAPGDALPALSVTASASTTLSTGTDTGDMLDELARVKSLRVALPTRVTIKAKLADADLGVLPLKQQASFRFQQESGPPVQLSTAVLNNDISGIATTSFDPTTQGVHVFSATVSSLTSDGSETGVEVQREIRVIVDGESNRLPEARVKTPAAQKGKRGRPGASDTALQEGDTVILDGTESADPDGAVTLAYAWVQVAGPEIELSDPFSSITTFVAPDFGDDETRLYAFQLVVDDAGGDSEPSLVSFKVGPAAASGATTRSASYTGGLNLIGVPLAAETTGAARTAQELIDGLGATFVIRVASEAGRGRFSVYLPGVGMTDPGVEGNQGYLISRPAQFKTEIFTGQPWPSSAQSMTLLTGVNFVSFPAGVPSTWTAQTLLDRANAAGAAASYVARTVPDPSDASVSNPGTGAFEVYLPGLEGTSFPLRSGRGYLLSVRRSAVLSLPSSE
ncbi:MAG: hypothetical protein HY816_06530 [Candidatus Wallbacteria bacterium]|nr:hypothetical protein [Candidatus Wallbacteria bacterium]